MSTSHGLWRLALLLVVAGLARPAFAQERLGTLTGWVEDTRGEPVSGALISLFGEGLRGSGLVTVSDGAGRFRLPSLPAGSYMLRALAGGELIAPARRITVLPNHSSVFTLSLAPNVDAELDEVAAEQSAAPKDRELRWLLRHKRRSVLETRDHGEAEAAEGTRVAASFEGQADPWLDGMEGVFELMATATPEDWRESDETGESGTLPTSLGVMRLSGGFAENGRWSLGGLLAESESNTWRMAAEFIVEPGGGHQIQAGAGYGTRYLNPLVPSDSDGRRDNHRVGALFVQDRWKLSKRMTASAGARYTHVGYLKDSHHLDPSAAIAFEPDERTRIQGALTTHTLTPGGDLLTLSTLAATPAIGYALLDDDLRAEKVIRYDLSFEKALDEGKATIGTHLFYEDVRNRLVNTFGGRGSARSLRVLNAPGVSARGLGLTLGRRFGSAVSGSVTYTYGQSWVDETQAAPVALVTQPQGDFHDVVARVQTVIERSNTRLTVYYRINALSLDDSAETDAIAQTPTTKARFDVQFTQGVPFLGDLTRAEWDLLLALRNVFYEPDEGGTLDELAVLKPPTRVLGGISVRF